MNSEHEQAQGPRRQIPRSEKIHRRRVKAEDRRGVSKLTQQIVERLAVSKRLAEIGKQLSSESLALSAMNLQEKARVRTKLEFEEYWLQAKIGVIGPERQEALYVKKLGDLKEKMPDTFTWFITPDKDGLSEAGRIRNAVMPRLAGYRTRG